jgi:Arc/MetJ-type ribon-helix-helix transcriptional regulator
VFAFEMREDCSRQTLPAINERSKCFLIFPARIFALKSRPKLTTLHVANIIFNMKTIAVTIDERTLQRIDRIMTGESAPWKSRSEIVRQALQEFIAHLERVAEEEREREIFHRHRSRINRQAAALVKEQAKP